MSEAMYLSIDGATAASGLPRSTIYLLLGRGVLTAKKCGRRTLIAGNSLRAYLDSLPAADIRTGQRRSETLRDAA
jgi:hypothetical protein